MQPESLQVGSARRLSSRQGDLTGLDSATSDKGGPTGCENAPEFLLLCGNAGLRAAIRRNAVTFPSQMVRLRSCDAGNDEPERIVQLYFVHGWSIGSICRRYRLSKKSVDNILNKWRHGAVAAGFVQEIRPRSMDDKTGTPEIVRAEPASLIKPFEIEFAGESARNGDCRGVVPAAEHDAAMLGDIRLSPPCTPTSFPGADLHGGRG
jgi:hypothetical protein